MKWGGSGAIKRGPGAERDVGLLHHFAGPSTTGLRPASAGPRVQAAGSRLHHAGEALEAPPGGRAARHRQWRRDAGARRHGAELRHGRARRPAARPVDRPGPRRGRPPLAGRGTRWWPRGATAPRARRCGGAGPSSTAAPRPSRPGLLALGLAPGDRIGIWSLNTAEWALVQFAAAKAGLILVTVNPAYRVVELDYRAEQGRLRGPGARARPSRAATISACCGSWRPSSTRRRAGRARGGAAAGPAPASSPSASRPRARCRFDEPWRALATPRGRRGWRRSAGTIAARGRRQHPVHQRHHRHAQGRDAEPPQHPQQRLFRRPGHAARRRRTGSASRCRSTIASAW